MAVQAQATTLPCAPEQATPLELARIEPDGTLISFEGERFRLAGLVWPDALEPNRQRQLRQALESAVLREALSFKPAAPPDRWGIRAIHLFVAERDSTAPPFWLQAGLVEAGLVPGWPDLPATCWHRLMQHESVARRARRGFWAPRAQAARHRALAANPAAHAGRRMVARWRVHSVKTSAFLTYVNIAPFFRVGASIGLTGKQVQDMTKAGQNPELLAQRVVIARFISAPTGLLRVRLVPGEALVPDDE